MATLKETSKEILRSASASHSSLYGDVELTRVQALLLLATAALSEAENDAQFTTGAAADGDEDAAEQRRQLKRARKLLVDFLPQRAEANAVADEKGLDLGQYSHTKVFDGNAKKTEKFARLMGGGKGDVGSQHRTFAPDSVHTKRVEHEVEEQFNAALMHKGKKGLGI